MAAKTLTRSNLDISFYLLLCSPYFPEINSLAGALIVTRFLVSVSGFSKEGLVFSLTVTVGERWRFTWRDDDTSLALLDCFIFFALLPWRVSSSSL